MTEVPPLTNAEVERLALERVVELERAAGREPVDTHLSGEPYDIDSPPRKIEVKAYGGSADGAGLPLEKRQVDEALSDPENFYVYVVDNIRGGRDAMTVRAIHGEMLAEMINRSTPKQTWWPTLRRAEYAAAERLDDGA